MNVLDIVGQLFKPAAELIDAMHTSDEEKLNAKAKLSVIQGNIMSTALQYEAAQFEAKKEIIVAEAKSESWLTRNWRPMVMLACMASVMAYWFGLTPEDVPHLTEDVIMSMFNLVKIGVGGYIVGRSAEKIAPGVLDVFKKKDKR